MISNQTAFTAQWPPYPPGFAVDQYSFVEGGIDLTKIYGSLDAVPCFTNFLADTRTSASESADLKDFALGNVDTCGKVELKKTWVGTAGNVDLKIGTTSAAGDVGTGTANGQDGTTGEKTVKPGTFWFTETQGASTNLANYNSTYSCVDQNGKAQGLPTNVAYSGSFSVPVDTGQDIVCTITNARKPQLKVDKVLVPAADAGKFNLQIDGSTAGTGANVGNGGTTGFLDVTAGQHTIGETAMAGTSLANYDTTYSCSVNGGTATTTSSVTVNAGQSGVCTITNTRKKVTVTTVKDFVGTPAPISISVAGQSKAITGDDSVSKQIEAGTNGVVFDETMTDAQKALYDTSVTCTGGGASSVYSKTLDIGTTDVTCTFTNTRKGQIVVKKVMVGGTASFAFTGTPSGTIDTNNGTISTDVSGGTYTSTETPKAGWDLTSLTCDDGGSATPSTTSGSTATFKVDPGETVTCTFTNTKRGDLQLVKHAVGGDGTFAFTHAISGIAPTLTTVGGTASDTSDLLVPASSYAVAEGVLPAGWDFTSASCALEGGGPTGVVLAKSISAITVEPGKTTICTFTNTKRGHIVVDKVTLPAGDPQSFSFTAGGAGYSNFALTDVAAPNNQEVVPGAYSVAESVPAGWDQTSAVCDKGETIGSLDVEPGETVTCTITNTKRGHIVVDKVTLPAGDPQSFSFTAGGAGYSNFALTDVAAPNNQEVVPGAYSVAESVPAGWDQTSAVCDKGETIGSLDVEPGETVTCTITNTKRGHIVVDKVTLPAGDPQSFSFTAGGAGYSNFALTDVAAPNNQEVVPGAYSVAESVPAGWDQTSAVCDKGETIGSLDVEPGETVTCTITNTKRGHIVVDKVTLPAGDPQSFSFTAGGAGYSNFALTDVAAPNNQEVVPGAYSVAESVPAGWDQTSAVCDKGETIGSLDVEPGETVTCTITNTKRGHIVVDKVTLPAGDPQSFSFTAGGAGYSNFALTDVAAPNNQEVVPGAYTATEEAVEGLEAEGAHLQRPELGGGRLEGDDQRRAG